MDQGHSVLTIVATFVMMLASFVATSPMPVSQISMSLKTLFGFHCWMIARYRMLGRIAEGIVAFQFSVRSEVPIHLPSTPNC